MVPNVDEKVLKKCKKKIQCPAEICSDKVTSLKSKKLISESLKNSKKSVKTGNETYNRHSKPATINYYDRFNNDDQAVHSSANEHNSDFPKSNRSCSLKIRRPSINGSTMWKPKLSRKFMRNNNRNKLNLYKRLIKILINAMSGDSSNNIIRNTMSWIMNEINERKSRVITQSSKSDDDQTNRRTISANENLISNNSTEINDQISGGQSYARNEIETSQKTGGKIFEKDPKPSTSKNFVNECITIRDIDDESTDRCFSIEKNDDANSVATIANVSKAYERPNSSNKIAGEKSCDKTRKKTYLQKCTDVFEFHDSDVEIEEIIPGTAETSEPHVASSRKKDRRFKGLQESEDNLSNVKSSDKLSPVQKAFSKNTKVRNLSKNKDGSNKELCIHGSSKSDKAPKGSEQSSVKKDKKTEKTSKDQETRNSNNQSKSNIGSKPAGRSCSCISKKLRDVTTSGYSIPSEIEYSSLNIRHGYGGSRSTGIKSTRSNLDIAKISPAVGEKKTKKFYSPLELNYSETLKSKLDPKYVSKNLNDSSKRFKVTSEKPAGRVSKAFKKLSPSNFTQSLSSSKNDHLDAKSDTKSSKSSKIPPFSKYSIPVSIEIDMTKSKLRKQSLSLNLVQSKITKYFSPVKVRSNNCPQRKSSSGLNLSIERDENGNKRINCNRSKTVSRKFPVIESDVVLKKGEKIIYLTNYTVQKPKLSLSQEDHLYDVLRENSGILSKTTESNQNIIFQENISPITDKVISECSTDLRIIEDTNTSGEACSVIPPSYSIFSNEDNENKPIIDINQILDTQQREELLAPWETVDIYEKINRWHEDTFE